jgi:hypothetical protein
VTFISDHVDIPLAWVYAFDVDELRTMVRVRGHIDQHVDDTTNTKTPSPVLGCGFYANLFKLYLCSPLLDIDTLYLSPLTIDDICTPMNESQPPLPPPASVVRPTPFSTMRQNMHTTSTSQTTDRLIPLNNNHDEVDTNGASSPQQPPQSSVPDGFDGLSGFWKIFTLRAKTNISDIGAKSHTQYQIYKARE